MSARQAISFLVGSDHRVSLLDALSEPMRPCELEDTQAASRATIQRTLSGFVERDWATKEAGKYRLTPAGALVRDAYREFAGVVETVDEVGTTLSSLDGLDIPRAALTEATATAATPTAPHAPLDRYTSHLAAADFDRLQGVCPVLSSVFNDAHQPVVEDGVSTELVIDERTFAAAQELAPESIEVGEAAPAFTLYVSPDPLDYGLAILDDYVFVMGYDDQGRLRGSLDGESEALRSWAEETFVEARADAERIDLAVPTAD